MKIFSWNVNGIRACIKNGFWDWLDLCGADIVCLQETKITERDLVPILKEKSCFDLSGLENGKQHTSGFKNRWHVCFAPASRPGYSGVLILSQQAPDDFAIGLGIADFDTEGRTIICHYPTFTLVNTYVPNGGPELARIPFKMAYSEALLKKLQSIRKISPNIILCGDMNVAHQEIDIAHPKANENNSGFTKTERDWFTRFLTTGYTDTFRYVHPHAKNAYSWWSYRFGAREKNIGWRIDYFVTTEEMNPQIKGAGINPNQRGSDHCPVWLEIH